jgi:hypothetical protein
MRRAAPLLILLIAAVGCGSSSSGGSNGTTTTAAANRRDQVAECMRKQGVNFPNRPAGASGPTGSRGPGGGGGGAGGFLFGGGGGGGGAGGPGFQNDPTFQAAAKKCGLNFNRQARFTDNTQFRTSINKFVACVRKNGYDMPAANFSGNGPVFNASKVNRNDPKFVKAAQKCQSLLAFGRGPTGPGGPPPGQ